MNTVRESISLTTLVSTLNRRAAGSALSDLRLRSDALREYLRDEFSRQPREEGSFLADPVIEGAFGYEEAKETLGDLAGKFFDSRLVAGLDQPPRDLAAHRFAAEWHPYTHQLMAWKAAKDPATRAYIVSSGTGSGKTECFVLPILDELLRESTTVGRIVGVRSLFLYPLNALINSQRDRLRAWTRGFDGRIRYCLYNGETPEQVRSAEEREFPEECRSRRSLRAEPPPILVTNATMLEYMLVRRDDSRILGASQGMLRWVVIDEAHTYVGSQAAELSMLLRRVIDAFGINRESVKFVATSATLGGDGMEGRERLRAFMADLAGVRTKDVSVVIGSRRLPALDSSFTSRQAALPDLHQLHSMKSDEIFAVMASSPALRELRGLLGRRAASLAEVQEKLPEFSQQEAIELLDLAANARGPEGAFLPIRAHLFERTQLGVWACLNEKCLGIKAATWLHTPSWPFGGVFFKRRERCDHCQSLVFELVRCADCGEVYLLSSEVSRVNGRVLEGEAAFGSLDEENDGFELIDLDESDDDSELTLQPATDAIRRLICFESADSIAQVTVDSKTGEFSGTGQQVRLVVVGDDGKLRCIRCGQSEHLRGRVFRPLRVGAPFLLNVAVPTLLESTAPLDAGKPLEGRRIITFSDSRQGTAKFAVRMQLDADRNRVRSCVYHQLVAGRDDRSARSELEEIERNIADLERAQNPALDRMLTAARHKREVLQSSRLTKLSWKDMADALERDTAIRDWMPEVWEQLSFGDLDKHQFGHFCLLREFLRRPRTQNSLETLGLAAIEYPAIDALPSGRIPDAFSKRGLSANDWKDFLCLLMDQFVRANSAVVVPKNFFNWMGAPVRTRYVIPPEREKQHGTQMQWPSTARPSKFHVLLAHALRLDLSNADDRRMLDAVYDDAWSALRPLMTSYTEGFLLDLRQNASICQVERAFVCPITRRFFHRTFRQLTPNVRRYDSTAQECEVVTLPIAPHAWWRDSSGKPIRAADVETWLDNSEKAVFLRAKGLWTYVHDRVVAGAPYYRTVEHSAQQESVRLREYEAAFREGDINVLSCSTTMEMGVDIGGISAIAMNNAPPSPANFLQRAGRAGRRGEAVTVSLTLCKSDPHGEAVFANPLWPFVTPIYVPRVSLDSDRVVQRHVNSFLLSEYLRTAVPADPPHLTAGWFFGDGHGDSPADGFVAWCKQVRNAGPLSKRMLTLVSGSKLAEESAIVLAGSTSGEIEYLRRSWESEIGALEADISRFAAEAPGSPGELSAKRQRERLTDEYLLRELTSRGFLPGYGFPTDIVPFITTTMKQLRREQKRSREREDSALRRRGYPSRELHLAIRDYAPGNEVVLDGRVFASQGVTLNWHIPPGDTLVRESQVFQFAWRCPMCASSGSERVKPEVCPACSHAMLDVHRYLRPTGFAVGISYNPHNRISSHLYVPVEEPWISASRAEWLNLDAPVRGRFRASPEGHVFHHSRGVHRAGFAICLRCGRADSDKAESKLSGEMRDHDRLRGGKDATGQTRCEGNDENWAVTRNVWLGSAYQTDVFEFQLAGGGLLSEQAALSISIAIRGALCRRLGVDEREIGCGAQLQRADTKASTWSVVLFDHARSGAGYASLAADGLDVLIGEAAAFLRSCSCDRACQRCLLSYETQYKLNKLDRKAGLRALGL